MKFEELKRRLKQGIVDPVYLFTGEETYFMEEAIRLIRSRSLVSDDEQANFHLFYGDDLDLDALLALARTLPLVGKARVIVLKGLDKIKKAEGDGLIRLLQKRYSALCLILVAAKIDQRTKLAISIKKRAVAVHFYKLFEDKIPGWIVQRVKSRGRVISIPLAQVMAQMLGNDLHRIENELAKIYLYMGQDKEITRQHLAIVSGEARIFSIFDLVKNLGEKKVENSLKILNRLMEEGVSHIFLLSMITRQFRHMYLARSLMEQGRGVSELARALGLPQMFARQVAEQSKHFCSERLQIMYDRLLATDLTLKSSSCQPRLILENLIIEMCQDSRQ